MGGDRHKPIPSPGAEIIERVGHDRVGCSLTLSTSTSGGKSIAERAKDVQRVAVRQLVIPIAVFFLETERAPLNAAASTDIEAAVGIRRRIKPRSAEDLRSSRGGPGGARA